MKTALYLYIIPLLLLASCSGSKNAKKEAALMETAPSWVHERPINKSYYIGIAKINKVSYPNNYQEIAKRSALTDLASEISVNIQSTSIVSSFEDQAGFQSDFSNYIQMEMTKDLAGYQIQGSFETSEMYMVYYRLSKSKWQQIIADRKKMAADKAYSILVQGQKEENELNYPAAIKSYLNAFLELKKYWNEAVYYTISEQQVRLDLNIRNALIKILSDFKLSVEPHGLEMTISNQFKSNIMVIVKNYKSNNLYNIPIKLYYRKSSMPYQVTVYSQNEPLSIPIENIKYQTQGLQVSLEIEIEQLLPVKSEDKRFLKFATDAYQENPINVPVAYVLPKIFIQSTNTDAVNYHYVADAIKQALGKQSFQITQDEKQADLLFNLKLHESTGTNDSKIKAAYVIYSIEVKDRSNSHTIYTFSSPKYKGVDYTIESAKEKAFVKAASEINESSFSDMLESITK